MNPVPDIVRNRIAQIEQMERSKEDFKNIRHQSYKVEFALIQGEKWCPSFDALAKKAESFTMPRCEKRSHKIKKRMQDILQTKGTFELFISFESKIIVVVPKMTCQEHCVL